MKIRKIIEKNPQEFLYDFMLFKLNFKSFKFYLFPLFSRELSLLLLPLSPFLSLSNALSFFLFLSLSVSLTHTLSHSITHSLSLSVSYSLSLSPFLSLSHTHTFCLPLSPSPFVRSFEVFLSFISHFFYSMWCSIFLIIHLFSFFSRFEWQCC